MTAATLGTLLTAAAAAVAAGIAGRRLAASRPVLGFALRRLALVVPTVIVVHAAAFALMRATPGGPFDTDPRMDPVVRAELAARYRLDRPLFESWLESLAGALRFDFGPSMAWRDADATDILLSGLPVSAALGALALLFAIVLGVPAGIVAALRRGSWIDPVVRVVSSLGLAIPNFLVATALIAAFSFGLGWFPPAGFGTWKHAVLPALALSLPVAAALARLVRTGLLVELPKDHVRTARAKGLGPARVLFVHALPGALGPTVAYLGPAAATVLTGSLVIESMAAIPGMGTHFVSAAMNRDYPLALGAVIIYTVLVSLFNLLADAAHAALDPRIKP